MRNTLFNGFTNQFTLSKSLSFELIPQGKTLENMEKAGILDIDKQRNANYQIVRKGIDEYHKAFIENALSSLKLTGLNEYYELFQTPYRERTDAEKKRGIELETNLRKQIAKQLRNNEMFYLLFSKDLISDILPDFFADDEEMLAALSTFDGFTTYFVNFHRLREALYSDERKSSSVANRIITDNLPKFITNMGTFEALKASVAGACIEEIEKWVGELTGTDATDGIVENMFSLDHFSATATQGGIENYNLLIGGYAKEDGTKYKGLNEYVNEYNQTVPAKERLPLFVPLYKQLLSNTETVSFIPEKFESDQEVLTCIKDFYSEIKETLKKQENLVNSLEEYDLDKIFVKNDNSLTAISKALYGDWQYIEKALFHVYDKQFKTKPVRSEERYAEKRRRHFAKIESFSIAELNDAIKEFAGEVMLPIQHHFKTGLENEISNFMVIDNLYDNLGELMTQPFPENKNLRAQQNNIDKIKEFLDALKDWQNKIKPLCGSGNESEKDGVFYGQFEILWSELFALNATYNKVRNYLTKKVSKAEKFKLNFSNPSLGDGWSVGVEVEKGCLLFKESRAEGIDHYYLGVINKSSRAKFKEYPAPNDESDAIAKMFYYQSADPTKSIMNLIEIDGETKKVNGRKEKSGPHAGENLILEETKNKYLPADINRIRLNKGYSKRSEHFNADDLQTFIKYYKERIAAYMPEYDFGNDFFDLHFDDWNDFTAYVKRKAYQVPLRNISKSWLEERVEEGDLYLFQIHNVDFNPRRKGKKKITTRYFEMLFDPANFENGAVYKLNGGAEIFYRPAALELKDTPVHVKGEPIATKNPLNEKKEATYNYNIYKNRKATQNIFIFNCSIQCNFSAEEETPLNISARKAIRDADEPIKMIGISRAENHLLYYTVIDEDGKIIEQKSLNKIETVHSKGYKMVTDYHALLEAKENERQNARMNWATIDAISNLKEGYLSQVVSILTKLMMKYNACITIEDVSIEHRRSRQKIEKAVYSKFDTALVNKLSFLIDKDKEEGEGSILHPLQLASPDAKDNQNGFLFYISPAYTTTLDPLTGFTNMFGKRLDYSNANEAALFVRKLQDIKYNEAEDYFEIAFDYSDFGIGDGTKTNWTACTYGNRMKVERNKQSGRIESESIDLTREFKNLFKENDIDITQDIQKQLLEKASPKLLRGFMELFKLTMKMYNKIADEGHILSPIRSENGTFYNTSENDDSMPNCSSANSAYNIARKGLLYIDKIRKMEDGDNSRLIMKNIEWLDAVQ